METEYSLIENIIIGFLNFLGKFLDLLPNLCADIPVLGYLTSAMDWFFSLLISVSVIIPIEDIAFVALLVFGLNGWNAVVFFCNWVVRRIADIIP